MKPSVGSNCVFRVFPGERERVAPLSPPRPPRGCRGAERPTLAPSEAKPSKEQTPASSETKPPPEQPMGERERVAPLSPRRPRGCRGAERPTLVSSETKPSGEQPASSETNVSTRTVPGELERAADLSHPVTRGGCRGAERPTPASSETKPSREQPAPSETNISTRTAPGERERVTALSLPSPEGV